MGKTVRTQITTYVSPEVDAQIVAIWKTSGHNRETKSSVTEMLVTEALDARHQRPGRKGPTRLN